MRPDSVGVWPASTTSPRSRPRSAERRTIDVDLAGRRLSVVTAGGVFSPDHVDTGTQVLLREAPPPPAQGTFLDLGCGWGPIALSLGLLAPDATVYAVDVNERALELTRENAAAAGLGDVRAASPTRYRPTCGSTSSGRTRRSGWARRRSTTCSPPGCRG